jgi:hypothetical protein
MEESMKIVRCKLGDKIHGPMKVSELRMIPGFTLSSLVSPESQETWEPAFKSIDLSVYFEQRTPVARDPIDSALLSSVTTMDRDHSAPERVPVSEIPPEVQAAPRRRRKPLLAAMLVLSSGCLYGAIHMAMPHFRHSASLPAVPLMQTPVQALPVASIPVAKPLITPPAPVKKKPVVKMSVHPLKHKHAAKAHKKKHKV